MNPAQPPSAKPNSSIKIDLRLICVILLLIIAGMLAAWKPWQHNSVSRKITIDGSATVKATPDEFVFNPSFEQTGSDLAAIKNNLNAEGTKLNNDLQKLSVKQEEITLDSSSYNDYPLDTGGIANQTFTLYATIKVDNQVLAQKVQDYLAGTDAKGQLTSTPQFSDAKEKQLESQARLNAISDAKQQAEKTAANLDGKLGKVISVSDQSNNRVFPLMEGAQSANSGATSTPSLPVTPGKSDVTSQVEVVFALN